MITFIGFKGLILSYAVCMLTADVPKSSEYA